MSENSFLPNDSDRPPPYNTEKSRDVLLSAPIGFFTSTPEGRFLTVNPAMARMLGYDNPAQAVEDITDIAAQVYADPAGRNHFKHLLETRGEIFSYEHLLIHRDGHTFWVSTNARAIRDDKGGFLYYQGFTSPIEDRKRAEKALNEKTTLLQYILDNMFELVSLADLEGNFKFVASSHNILGYDLDSLVGRNVMEFVHPDDLSRVLTAFSEFITNREEFRKAEYRYRKSNGTYLWFETLGRLISDEEGNPKEVLFSTRDVTERKKTDQALRDSESRAKKQRAAIACMALDDLIFTGDISEALWKITEILSESIGVERAGIWMLSENYSELHCHSLFDAKTKTHSSGAVLKTADFPAYFNAILTESRIYAEDAQNDPRTSGLNKQYLAPLGITSLLDAGIIIEGTIAGVICLEHIENIRKWHSDEESFASMAASIVAQVFTNRKRRQAEEEQKKLQDQLNHARKMESVGQLAGGVAHDFNNMLNVILGYSELAMENSDPKTSQYKKLQEIYNAACRSADMTRKLLAFARKQEIEPRILDLNETIEKELKILRRLIGEDVDLTWHPCPRIWPVKMDPSQIDQVLTNLCVNARDAVCGAGRITIETSTVRFDEAYCDRHADFLQGDYVMLTVSDDGCGMDEKTREKLFDPFFTTKAIGKGTGLGLATVYGIIKQNNGFINVSSQPGQGTTFRIYFARHVGSIEPDPEKLPEKQNERGRETILVVEDEPMNLDICKTMLESLGYLVLSSTVPEKAIDIARKHDGKIDLLLTDVVMPGMNGRELSERIISIYPAIKCIFMSGHTADMISKKGVLDEGVYFLQKPFSISELASKVRETIRKGSKKNF